MNSSVHAQMATEVWQMIRGLMGADLQTPSKELVDLDAAAIQLIEMACNSAAESQRVVGRGLDERKLVPVTTATTNRPLWNDLWEAQRRADFEAGMLAILKAMGYEKDLSDPQWRDEVFAAYLKGQP